MIQPFFENKRGQKRTKLQKMSENGHFLGLNWRMLPWNWLSWAVADYSRAFWAIPAVGGSSAGYARPPPKIAASDSGCVCAPTHARPHIQYRLVASTPSGKRNWGCPCRCRSPNACARWWCALPSVRSPPGGHTLRSASSLSDAVRACKIRLTAEPLALFGF